MATLKRDPIKYIRDRIKSQYKKDSKCRICDSTQSLEFHHFNSVAEMYKNWAVTKSISIETAEDIVRVRDEFIKEHWNEMVKECVTICAKHHSMLHKIYGKSPRLSTAPKQQRWVEKQRTKHQV